jgi:hypothetical protein
MRKFLLAALAALGLALAAPSTASAMPLVTGDAIKAAADSIGTPAEAVRHRYWHRSWAPRRTFRRYYAPRRYYYRRRYWR